MAKGTPVTGTTSGTTLADVRHQRPAPTSGNRSLPAGTSGGNQREPKVRPDGVGSPSLEGNHPKPDDLLPDPAPRYGWDEYGRYQPHPLRPRSVAPRPTTVQPPASATPTDPAHHP
jgi:hypothetical protein